MTIPNFKQMFQSMITFVQDKKGIIGPLQLLVAGVILLAIAGTTMTLLARVNDKLDDGLTGNPLDVAANATQTLVDVAAFQPTIGLVVVIVVILLLLTGVIATFARGRG